MSPFIVMSTCDAAGRCDASPKGDAPGFVTVLNDEMLLIPDRLGNNRVDSIGNILQHPRIGLLFMVPGIRETLRVNGRAQVTVDPQLLESCAVNGKAPRSAILVTADEVYFHCGKALIRSDLWNPQKHVARSAFPSLGIVIAEQIGQVVEPKDAERMTEESYVARLY
jgi:PPOX class probable FMN-dependent enzyme